MEWGGGVGEGGKLSCFLFFFSDCNECQLSESMTVPRQNTLSAMHMTGLDRFVATSWWNNDHRRKTLLEQKIDKIESRHEEKGREAMEREKESS